MINNILKKIVLLAILSIVLILPALVEAKFVGDHIYLVPEGDVDPKMLSHIKEAIPASFPFAVKVEILPKEELLKNSHDATRMQYDADKILIDFTDRNTVDARIDRFLLIANVDLYVPKTNYIFGLSYPDKGASIMSITRLANEFYGQKPDVNVLFNRVTKEAVQELGHSWKLKHCPDPKCVMHFSDNLQDLDKQTPKFCVNCRHELRKR